MNQNKFTTDTFIYFKDLINQYDFSIVDDNSLFSGNGAKLLVLLELQKLNPCIQNELNIKLLENYIRENIDENNDLSFGGGLFGNLYLLLYLNRKHNISFNIKLKNKYDTIANDFINNCFNENIYDLQDGFIGIGIYAIECLNNNLDSINVLKNIIDWLTINYINDIKQDGIYWNYHLQGEKGTSISIGLLHGITSILTFLSISHKYVNVEYQRKIDFLLSKGLNYLISLKHTNSLNYFPGAIDLTEANRFNNNYLKLSYCTSELGIYHGLNTINNKNNKYKLEKELYNIDDYIIKSIDMMDFSDPYFCHGTTGILYHYITKQKSDDSNEIILRLINRIKEQSVDTQNAGLLSGATGVILTIFKYLNYTYDTAWERALLLN